MAAQADPPGDDDEKQLLRDYNVKRANEGQKIRIQKKAVIRKEGVLPWTRLD